MITNLLGAPVVVLDLDGCLSQNRYHDTRTFEPQLVEDMWHEHWMDPDVACHEELVDMVRGLMASGWAALILTARPFAYQEETVRWLQKTGPWSVICHNRSLSYNKAGAPDVHLVMRASQHGTARTNAEWKRDIIRNLQIQGVDVRFAVEDYKPNADAIREVVPVLLYERKRDSKLDPARWCPHGNLDGKDCLRCHSGRLTDNG